MAETARIRLTARGSKLAHHGHPWFFADDLESSTAEPGSIVRAVDEQGRDLGLGFLATTSRIRLRLCGPWPGPEIPAPKEFFAARLATAVARREALVGGGIEAGAPGRVGLRLVHGESDWLPGLVVDRYAQCVVVQVTSAVVERHLEHVVSFLAAMPGVEMVLARNDTPVRELEGLSQGVTLLHGSRIESTVVEEGGLRIRVFPFTGHKTGLYLDQRDARACVRTLAAGRDVLDLFSYQGGFALAALAGGAKSALAIDQSESALQHAHQAAADNGLAGLATLRANAFDAVRAQRKEGRQFGLVVVDPPAFCKSKKELEGGLRGYRELNRQALRLVAPGGLVLTCSCSHHVRWDMFETVLRQAASELPFRILLRRRIMAAADHPVWLNLPETEYLKVCLLERTD
jgi:23S rRNA (cytosine1962-C5)-methyltransferase